MDDQNFEVLEEKIDQVLSMLSRLKTENRELQQKNTELQSVVDEKEKTIQTLKSEYEHYHEMQTEIETYREKQDRIRSKVETLLQKLKEFEDIQ